MGSAKIINGNVNDPLMKIHFLVLGGGAGGLSAAIALCRAGHRVTVLEVKDHFEKTWGYSGAITIPPNMSKLLVRWGMERQLEELAVRTREFLLTRFENGDTLGIHHLHEDMLKDCGGDVFYMNYPDLRRALRATAVAHGATMHQGPAVASILIEEGSSPSVTLDSGEILEADVIVAADGPEGVARKVVLQEELYNISLGLTLYKMLIPVDLIQGEPELGSLLQTKSAIFTWLGDVRGAVGYLSGVQNSFTLQVYVPEKGTESWWKKNVDSAQALKTMGQTDTRLRKLVELAKSARCLPVNRPALLESCVHPSGRLVLIGDAAHAFPTGSMHCASPSLEDAAALGEFFRHLHHEDQIDSFLMAFDEIRSARIPVVLEAELGRLQNITMPNGEAQQFRDANIRKNHGRGLDAFVNEDGDILPVWEEDKKVFAYDPEDHAAEWWNDWGLLQERAREVLVPTSLASLCIQVDSESQDFAPTVPVRV